MNSTFYVLGGEGMILTHLHTRYHPDKNGQDLFCRFSGSSLIWGCARRGCVLWRWDSISMMFLFHKPSFRVELMMFTILVATAIQWSVQDVEKATEAWKVQDAFAQSTLG